MTQISHEAALEGLWQALDWAAPAKLDEIFDELASRLRRHSRFAGMSITEIDLLLADTRRELEHDLNEYEWCLIRAFKDAIQFDDEAAA
jgi:hypothetical protein